MYREVSLANGMRVLLVSDTLNGPPPEAVDGDDEEVDNDSDGNEEMSDDCSNSSDSGSDSVSSSSDSDRDGRKHTVHRRHGAHEVNNILE